MTPRAPSSQGFLDVRGARLRWQSHGQEGPVLLLLHGWALDGRMWTPQLAALSRRYRVVSLDRRGFGRSTGQASIEREVGDIQALCLRLHLRPFAIVGMSQGTRVALRLAQRRVLPIRRLVLDGPPAPQRRTDRQGEDPPLEFYRSLLRARGVAAFRRAWSHHPLMRLQRSGTTARWLVSRMLQAYRGKDLVGTARPAGTTRPVRPEAIRQKTLVIAGSLDQPSRIEAAKDLALRLPRAQWRAIPGAGHLANLDSPDAWLRTVAAFLRK